MSISVIRGTNGKPAASRLLAEEAAEWKDWSGKLFIGYPIVGGTGGAHRIDALLVSNERGLVVFDLIEGSDLGDFRARQDETANLLDAKLRTQPGFTRRRDAPRSLVLAPCSGSWRGVPLWFPFGIRAIVSTFALGRALRVHTSGTHRLPRLFGPQNVLVRTRDTPRGASTPVTTWVYRSCGRIERFNSTTPGQAVTIQGSVGGPWKSIFRRHSTRCSASPTTSKTRGLFSALAGMTGEEKRCPMNSHPGMYAGGWKQMEIIGSTFLIFANRSGARSRPCGPASDRRDDDAASDTLSTKKRRPTQRPLRR